MSRTNPTSSTTTKTATASPYLTGGLDTIEVLRAKLNRTQFEGFCAGQAERRLHRGLARSASNDWNNAMRDWETAKWYLDQLLASAYKGGPVTDRRPTPLDENTVVDYYSSNTPR